MTYLIKLKKEFPNPVNIQNRTGIKNKIISVRLIGNEIVIEMEQEPTEAEMTALKQYFTTTHWVVNIEHLKESMPSEIV